MKEDLEAPLALQKRALAELMSLKVRPAPQLKLYRDIATAILTQNGSRYKINGYASHEK